jgi:hypothetical protein
MHSQLRRDQAQFVAMQGTGPLINRRDLLAATGLGGLAPATAGAMKPRPVPPVAAAELLALIGAFAVAEKLDFAHVNADAGSVATKGARDAWHAVCDLHLERLDALGEQLNERIENIVGALPAAVVLPDERICLALQEVGPDGLSRDRPGFWSQTRLPVWVDLCPE